MYYLYVTLILALVATALWAIVCFHYVLQQQRSLNALWGRASLLFMERNKMLGELQNLWVSPNAPKPDAHFEHLQELLAQDVAAPWLEVEQRNALRLQIDAEAQHVLSHAKALPQLAQNPALPMIEERLAENAVLVLREIDLYNRAARLYNNLLQVNPNRLIAQWLGFLPAPIYGQR